MKARITLQVSAQVLQRLQDAAALSGASLKQFLVQAAQKEADRIIERAGAARAAPKDAVLAPAAAIKG